ncbi:MAG: zinc ribbon protein [Verrucomicrobiaceae bacterium]|nr:zinc ribbon protein [Verrucomicrobiaceae bacterium]MDB6118354.1 zinc ribbon protein [Verrucomicrobiaceae bacterium]
MPTYEYQCLECGDQFEARQSMKDPHLTECPKCRGKVKRKISLGSGLIFKGSGFYITDYRSDSYKAAAKADSSGGSSSTPAPAAAPAAPSPAPSAPAAGSS